MQAAMLAACASLCQWQFKLDTTFRTTILEEYVNSIYVFDDGSLFLSGRIKFPGDISVRGSAKILTNGQLDNSFTMFPQTTGGGKLVPWQNKIYVMPAHTVRRLNGSGLIDASFIHMNSGPYFHSQAGGDYHVFEDGRVLVSGTHLLSDSIRGFMGYYNLIWFSNEGYLDTTRVHRQANGHIRRFTALPNGKFLCSCNCNEYDGQPVAKLFRIHEDGSLDTSFQSDVYSGIIFSYYPLSDGRVYVGGRFTKTGMSAQTFYYVRLMPDGSLDPTFNNFNELGLGGILSGEPQVNRIVPWQDKLFVTGHFRTVNGDIRGGIFLSDTTGQDLLLLDDCLPGSFNYYTSTFASILGILPTLDSSGFYIWGAYHGYNDGLINDPGQRFVSRLLVEEVEVETSVQAILLAAHYTLRPNPASHTVHINTQGIPGSSMAVVRDAMCRLVHVQRLEPHGGTLDLQELPDGVYFVSISANEIHLPAQRLVLQR